ncbi:MAG: pectin acetylesterase-family hydrolase, partial [Bradymonadia bacterium]
MMKMLKALMVMCVLLPLQACDSDSDNGGAMPMAPEVDMAVEEPTPLPMPEVGVWETVRPGGETLCSRGSEYRFYFRGGDPAKVMVYFQGGGACWDDFTCSVADAIFSDRVTEPEDFNLLAEQFDFGVFDTSEDSPYKDYTLLYIPYCTGDVHWGDATVEYANELTIHHRGYQNTQAALNYLYERVFEPREVFVTGCSAGAYGSVLNSVMIAEHYSDTRMAVLADSGSGIITDTFLNDSFPGWNALAHLPPTLTRLMAPLETLSIKDVYQAITESYPQHRFAQHTTEFDSDQTFFFEAMGGDFREWSGKQRELLRSLDETQDNFRVYLAPGPLHCIGAYPYFSERVTNGVRFADWQRQFIEGDTMPESVYCEGLDCFEDDFCEQCAANDGGPGCRFCNQWPERYDDRRQA